VLFEDQSLIGRFGAAGNQNSSSDKQKAATTKKIAPPMLKIEIKLN